MQRFLQSLTIPLVTMLLAVLAGAIPAAAATNAERFQMGRDIRVEANDKTGDVSCINCSVYVQGHVSGDIFALNGNIVLEKGAAVSGDLAAIGGDVRLEDGTGVGGEVAAIGGMVRRDPGATIAGDVTAMGGKGWLLMIVLSPFLVMVGIIAFIVWLVRRNRRPVPVHA